MTGGNDMKAADRAADHGELAVSLMKMAADRTVCPNDLVARVTSMAVEHATAALRCARSAVANEAAPVLCPGCSGQGVTTLADPNVMECQGCGGFFTVRAIARRDAFAFVDLTQMQANAGPAGAFYFDFTIGDSAKPYRAHGWADKVTKAVVQFG